MHDNLQKKATLAPRHNLSGLNKHVWRRYTSTSILKSGFNSRLVYASQWIRTMQKSKATSGYSVPKVPSLCKHLITLTPLPDLHPSTSGVFPYFTHCTMKPISETPAFKGHAVTCTNAYRHFRKIILYCAINNGWLYRGKPFRGTPQQQQQKTSMQEQQMQLG